MKNLIFTFFLVLIVSALTAQSDAGPKKQMSLVTKHTATWCPICSADAWDTQKYFMNNLDGNNAFVMSAHISGSSKLYSKAAKDLLSAFSGVFYQPEFFFNTQKITGSIQTKMEEQVNAAAMQAPLAQTEVELLYNPETDMLKVNTMTEFFEATEGTYQLSVLLVQKEVYEEQAGRGSNELHQNVLRKALTEDVFGPEIASGSIDAGTQVTNQVSLKWDNQYDFGNIRIMAILWKRDNSDYEFVNINASETVETESTTTSSRNVDALTGRFDILPNATSSTARVQFDLPQAYANAEILLFDQYGRVVRTLHRGAMPAGEQTLQLDREGVSTGMYFVRFRAGSTLATRRVVFF